MHVVTGHGERESFRPDDYLAYYRRLRAALPRRGRARGARPTRTRSSTAGSASSSRSARQRWAEDDHLTLVAGVSRLQVERLTAAGITTLEALAEADPDTKVPSMRASTFEGLNHQARLQLHHRRTGEHVIEHLPRGARPRLRAPAGAEPRATSGSTSRATRGSSRRAGSST